MKKILLVVLIMISVSPALVGQDRFAKLTWEISLPMGDMDDFLVNEDVSFGGVSYDYRKLVTDNISVGGNFSWNFFNGSTREDLVSGTTTVSGLRQFYFNALPIMVNAHFYQDIGKAQIYIGSGVGGVWTLQRTDIGSYFTDNNNFQFGFMPEIGVNIPISLTSNINLSAKYNVALESANGINVTYFAFGIGWSSWW